jgi:hypothetical protein
VCNYVYMSLARRLEVSFLQRWRCRPRGRGYIHMYIYIYTHINGQGFLGLGGWQ